MNRRNVVIGILVIAAAAAVFVVSHGKKDPQKNSKQISPAYGTISNVVSATGTVQPQNRLQIKPPIGGRIEKILVQEGQSVKTGDILAVMSSTERAALLDAARLQGGEGTVKEWEDVYKPTPLLAPIDGEVIVKSVNPGQTVTPSDDVVVLSDRLIVQAQVDETDIGKVKVGQMAMLSLDAYPQIKVKGRVDHIYYESKLISNVTIYQVDIVPQEVPEVFRSGMSANVQIVQEQKENVLLITKEAVKKRQDKNFVMVDQGFGKPVRREIELGIADENNVEVLSGLSPQDKVVIVSQKYTPPKGSKPGSSPFMPQGGGGGRGR